MIVMSVELQDDLYVKIYDLDKVINGKKFTLEDFRKDNWHEFKYIDKVLELKTYDNGESLLVALCIDGVIIDSDSIPDREVNL